MSGVKISDIQTGIPQLDSLIEIESAGGISGKTTVDSLVSLGVPKMHINGFEMTNNVTLPNTDLDIGAGVAVDDARTSYFTGAALTKKINVAFVEGNNQGCADTGFTLSANATVHIHLVPNDSSGAVDYIANSSTNSIAKTGYTWRRRVRSRVLDASGLLIPAYDVGDYTYYESGGVNEVSNDASLSQSPRLYVVTAPADTIAFGSGLFRDTGATPNSRYVAIYNPDYVVAGTDTHNMTAYAVGSGVNFTKYEWQTKINALSQIGVLMKSATLQSPVLYINCHGFIDYRGRI